MSEKNGVSVGTVAEVKGHATVVHLDGTQETMTKGLSVFAGDIIETDAAGAVNITFNDNTVFAVSNNAKMTIDEFVYDPNKDGKAKQMSRLCGVFLCTPAALLAKKIIMMSISKRPLAQSGSEEQP
jgi:hypothetical protein